MTPAEESEIAERVRLAWTGNARRDLAPFPLGEVYRQAQIEWLREAQRRYERKDLDSRKGWKR